MLFTEHVASSDAVKQKLSGLSSAALTRLIVESDSLTPDQKAEIGILVVGMAWANEADKNRVLNVLKVEEEMHHGKRRRSVQDYMSMHHYFSEQQWAALLDADTPGDVKLSAILGHMLRLGLRCPSEPL